MWEYYVWNGVGDDTLQVTVTLDSLDSQGVSHVRHHRQILSPLGPPEFPWFESYVVDTTNRVFGSGWLPPNSLVFELEAQVGQWWIVDRIEGRIARVEEEFPDTIFGQPTMVKLISYYVAGDTSDTTTWLHMYTEHLARGFGTIFRISGELGYNLYLRGCVIAGTRYGDTVLVSVPDEPRENVGGQFTLNQNYPNPFNSSTTITFDLLVFGQVSLIIFDLLGREVSRVFDNEVLHMGRHTAVWPGLRSDGQLIASGVYICRIQSGGLVQARRLLLLK